MNDLLEALNQLEPMKIPAVDLYARRHEEPPTPEQLIQATDFMEKLAERCRKMADRLNTLSPEPVLAENLIWEFPL